MSWFSDPHKTKFPSPEEVLPGRPKKTIFVNVMVQAAGLRVLAVTLNTDRPNDVDGTLFAADIAPLMPIKINTTNPIRAPAMII
jgi:hypothetical protein